MAGCGTEAREQNDGVRERDTYAQFVDGTLRHLALGLEETAGTSVKSVGDAVRATAYARDLTTGQRVLVARFLMSADDATYLQAGLAALWSSAGGRDTDDGHDTDALALAPAGLYAPDCLAGVKSGMEKALKLQHDLAFVRSGDAVHQVKLVINLLTKLYDSPFDPGRARTLESLIGEYDRQWRARGLPYRTVREQFNRWSAAADAWTTERTDDNAADLRKASQSFNRCSKTSSSLSTARSSAWPAGRA